jgi:hypothetical protein
MGYVLLVDIFELPMKGKKYFSQEPCLINGLMIHSQHLLKILLGNQVFLLQFINFNSFFLDFPLDLLEGASIGI